MHSLPEDRTRRINDLEIEHLILIEAELCERVADLEADNRALRETLQASITALHHLTTKNAQLRTCLRRDLWETYGWIADERRRAAA